MRPLTALARLGAMPRVHDSATAPTKSQRLAGAGACGERAMRHLPLQRFRVGAAVLSSDGAIASGCNVENASFGLTICAERNAVFRAIADGARAIVALSLYTPTPGRSRHAARAGRCSRSSAATR